MESSVTYAGCTEQQRHVIDDPTKVGEARRAAQALANSALDSDASGRVAIVASELAGNLLRHANGGELLIQARTSKADATVELLAIDRGPGMGDVNRCLTDGYSTGRGTPGTGLGAVRRLATDFDIYSMPGEGTVVMARFGSKSGPRYGAISLPLAGEDECGDAWSLRYDGDVISLFLVDGLGHGSFAAEAARAAVCAFANTPFAAPMEVLMRANSLMSKTRGGAAACAKVQANVLHYAGVGNISASLVVNEKSKGMASHNGTLGMYQRNSRQFQYEVTPGALLVMHSDGLSARWDLKGRSTLLRCDPVVIAAVLWRDYARDRDDATVVVLAT